MIGGAQKVLGADRHARSARHYFSHGDALRFRNGIATALPSAPAVGTAQWGRTNDAHANRAALVSQIAERFAVNAISVYDWLTGIDPSSFDLDASILLLTMGIRQSMGLLVLPIVTATGVSLVSISLALAIGQFVWGAAQPIFGAIAGGIMGGLLLHKLNERVLRVAIVLIGIALTIGLFAR